MLAIWRPAMAESLAELWAALHKATPLVFARSEAHYLKALALTHNDERISLLLLKKLSLARVVPEAALPDAVVRLNSYVEYRAGGGELSFARLRHPTAPDMPAHGLSIASGICVGLLGLQAGHTILWPNIEGRLRPLEVNYVENCGGVTMCHTAGRTARPAPRGKVES